MQEKMTENEAAVESYQEENQKFKLQNNSYSEKIVKLEKYVQESEEKLQINMKNHSQ